MSRWTVLVGGRSRDEVIAALDLAGVHRNAHAETLLAGPSFGSRPVERVTVVDRTVADLGLVDGGTLLQILAAAGERGLRPCPPDAAPALRLATLDQPASSTGRRPGAPRTAR